MPPVIGKNLFHLLAKLPQNGLSSRVAPIPWALTGRVNSYYTITSTHLSFIPLVDGLSYPVKLVNDKLVPADAAYSKSQLESSQIKAEEKRRATRAGEMVADADMRENLRVEKELDELMVQTNSTVLRPDGRAWGVLVEEGVPASDPTPQLIEVDAWKFPWREISDEEISLSALKSFVPKPHPKGHRRSR